MFLKNNNYKWLKKACEPGFVKLTASKTKEEHEQNLGFI